MSINSSPINTFPINGNAQNSLSGDAQLLFSQNVVAVNGDATLYFSLIVASIGDVSLDFNQTVNNPSGDVLLLLSQVISDGGDVNLLFTQNIYTPASISDSWDGWDISVIIDGVDKSKDLIDKLTIDAEISSARTADFSILLSGVVNPSQWAGKSVEINYIQNNNAVWRRFSGVIERPEYDVSTKALRCACTDKLQFIVNGYSNQQLKTLTAGYWHQNVFNADNTGWDYVNDLLKTVNKSVHLDSNKQLIVADLQNEILPDYIFDDDLILDSSLSVQLSQRNQLINKVDISFQARYERLFHKDNRFLWLHPRDVCDEISNPVVFPTKQMVADAVADADRRLTSEAYTSLWPTGIYTCPSGQAIFSNNSPESIRGFNIRTAFRWSQSITELINISVSSPLSIQLDGGEVADKISSSIEFKATREEWGSDDDDYSTEVGLIADGNGNFRKNDFVLSDINSSLEVLIAEAINTITQSHSKNIVLFDLPLSPYLELGDTVETNDPDVSSKGVVRRFVETYDFNAGTPITNVELQVSTGGSGLDRVDSSVGVPPISSLPVGADVANISLVDTHIGGLIDSVPQTDNMEGVILNVSLKSTAAYSDGLKIPFDAIDDSIRLNLDETSDYQIKIAVPDNLLNINA